MSAKIARVGRPAQSAGTAPGRRRTRWPTGPAAVVAAWIAAAWFGTAGPALAADRPAACAPVSAVVCPAGERCPPAPLFDVADYWHGLAGCLRGLRDLWSRHGADTSVDLGATTLPVHEVVRRQVIGELARPTTGLLDDDGRRLAFDQVVDERGRWQRPPTLLVQRNDLGRPYNAMAQGDLAYFLGQFGVLARRTADSGSNRDELRRDSAMYLALSRASIEVNLRPVDQGGLASSSPCADGMSCTWYHSVTRRDRASAAGGTLNQHLHATRDLALLAVLAETEGLPDAARYRAGSQAGLAQLLVAPGMRSGASVPNLADFLPHSPDRLAYYGFGLPEGKGYHLGSHGRDCNYHLHVLDLLASTLELNADAVDRQAGLRRAASDCRGPLASLFRTMRRQFESRRQPAASAARSGVGGDASCPALEQRSALDARLVDLFSSCRP